MHFRVWPWLPWMCLAVIPAVTCTLGIDIFQPVTRTQFACLKDNGYEFAIVRVYRSNGIVDTNSARTIRNARTAGFKRVDAYMLPCVSCGDVAQQVSETMEYLEDSNVTIDMIWLAVEGTWHNDTNLNTQFLRDLIAELNNTRVAYGIATSSSQWWNIIRHAAIFPADSSPPLWYSQCDREKSFNGFQPFGSWKQPAMKQFARDVSECSVILGKNFL